MFGLLSQICTWSELHENEPELIQVETVTFKKDFGPYDKGDKVHILSLTDDGSGTVLMHEWSKENIIIKSIKVELAIIKE